MLPGQSLAVALRVGQRIDDPAEQNRLGEQSRCKREIGEGERPAKPDLGAEQT